MIAQLNGIGYQPLMRQVLARFADCEKKKIFWQAVREMKQRREEDAASEELRLVQTVSPTAIKHRGIR